MLNQFHLGMVAGINAIQKYKNTEKIIYPDVTVIGSLAKYINSPNDNFQPMNANFGIMPELDEKIKDKKERYLKYAERSLNYLKS